MSPPYIPTMFHFSILSEQLIDSLRYSNLMSLLPHFKREIPTSVELAASETVLAPVQCYFSSASFWYNKLESPQGGSEINRWNLISSLTFIFALFLSKILLSFSFIYRKRYLMKAHLAKISAWQSLRQKPWVFMHDLGIDLVPDAMDATKKSWVIVFSTTMPARTVHSLGLGQALSKIWDFS